MTNGTSIEPAPSNDLTGSMNNLVSGQRSPRIESLNGELRLPTRCPEEIVKYPRQFANDTYVAKYPSRRASQERVKQDYTRETDKLNPDLKKYNYTCDENLHNYPQRCGEEYQRCSDNNLIYDQYATERKFGIDLQKYPQRYSEDTLRYREDEPNRTYIDLQKFPQRYREDPSRLSHSQHTLKYNNLRCTQHGSKYPMSKSILPNRILGTGGIPIIGQTAISLVVNRFGSAPLNHEMAFAENSLYPSESTEEDMLNRRFIMGSMSDNDDI